MDTLEPIKAEKKILVWRCVGEGYSFLFNNLPRFATYAVPLAALLMGYEYLAWTETGMEIDYFLFGWMWRAKFWLLSGDFFREYESYRFSMEYLSWSPLFGGSIASGWTPYILAEAAFATFWIRAFLHANRDMPWRARPFAIIAGKIFAVIWVFDNLRFNVGFAEYWLFMKGIEYAMSRDSIFLLMVSIFVALPVVLLLLCRIPLAIPAIVAGTRRLGVGGIAAPGLFGNIRLLAALMLAALPIIVVSGLLAQITGASYDSPRYTDSEILVLLIRFGQKLAVFASIAVSYGIYTTAWYLQADESQSADLSTPYERMPGMQRPPTPPDYPPPAPGGSGSASPPPRITR